MPVNQLHQIDDLKEEVLELISSDLNPLREKYHYGDYDLGGFVSWRPMVLIIGNYSAGKSTFINELVGEDIQRTGQAPTDDCFTVITYQDDADKNFIEERDGRVLLGDESLPFKRLKSQGERFLSHFRLKKVRSDILKNLALIDTPGMLDSISERDRGYNYQEVIGELASLADLIILLFDSHKAGTVRESYESLRNTLPKSTMEDRVLFVLNRVDECQSIDDLMRVHGALCWNLSQMTGRKDIPQIHLTYSPQGGPDLMDVDDDLLRAYLKDVSYQKQEVIHRILDVPRKRIDHLATYLEIHCQRMHQFISACQSYSNFTRLAKYSLSKWITISCLIFAASIGVLFSSPIMAPLGVSNLTLALLFSASGALLLVRSILSRAFFHRSKRYFLSNIHEYVTLKNQYETDHWNLISADVKKVIDKKHDLLPDRKVMKMDKKDMEDTMERVAYLRNQISRMSPDKTEVIGTVTEHQKQNRESFRARATKRLRLIGKQKTFTDQNIVNSGGKDLAQAPDDRMTQIIGKQIDLLDQSTPEAANK